MLNLSSLFYTTTGESCLLNNIDIPESKRLYLSDVKSKVRHHLKEQLPKALKAAGIDEAIEPRFFTQGSWSYKTINAPCTTPPQQADMDDGCYLPMSFIQETSKRPKTASKFFFSAIESCLQPLAQEHDWELDTSKATCVRIIIDVDSHMDIPLYAIPDDEFPGLEKAALSHGFINLAEAMSRSEVVDIGWSRLPDNEVLLAHREDDWISSDPRPIRDWFEGQVALKGAQLRRVVRYIKAWRDHQWASGGPSSLLLMVAIAEVFEKQDRRDDLALLKVSECLPNVLKRGVDNPTSVTESLTKRLGAEGVKEACEKLEKFTQYLSGAIQAQNSSQACTWVVNQFGPRFPNEPDRIQESSIEAAVAASSVLSTSKPPVVNNIVAG